MVILTILDPFSTSYGPPETGFLQQSFPTMVHLVQNNALNNHILTEYFSGESTRQRIRSSLFQLGDYSELGATVTEAR